MFEKILVPLDGSQLAECVFPHLVKLTKDCVVKEIVIFNVCEPPIISADYPAANMSKTWEQHVEELTQYSKSQCSLYLLDAEKKLNSLGIKNLKKDTRLGKAADEIVDYAAQNGVDLIVMASHGRSGPSRWAFGSVTDKVFRSTCVPVMMVRGPGCVASI